MGNRMKIFDDSDDDDEEPTLKIDREFARRFKHNKVREELHRYEELKARGLVPDDPDFEEEDENEVEDDGASAGRSKKELKFFEALIKVKKQDPSLKQKEVVLFSDSEPDENDDGEKKEKKKKPMYLKDVVASHLLDEGADFGGDEKEQKDRGENDQIKSLAYDEEQERIRREFLEAAAKEEEGEEESGKDDGELLKMKEKIVEESDSDDEELKKKVDEYFDEDDENSKFLKEYFVNKMWIEKPGVVDVPVFDDVDLQVLSEDEDLVNDQEDFEYRYQENAGDRVLGHARNVVDTARKVENTRALQRKSKEQRMEAARLEREEELRHMKNVKRKDMEKRVRRIMAVAGLNSDEIVPMSARELESEFDPAEYDRMMKKAFGDEYYDGIGPEEVNDDDDDDDEAGKPNFDEEDEKLGLEKGWDGRDAMVTERLQEEEEEEEVKEEEAKEEEDEEGKRKRKRKSALVEKAKQEWLDEYFKLDYEDTIGDLKTRFKYGKTKRNRYGLTAMEILAMDDKDLGQYVPLKKIALYKDEEYKVPNSKRYEIKLKAQEALRSQSRSDSKKKNKNKKNKAQDEESSKKKNKNKKSKEEREEEEPCEKKEVDEDKPSSSAVPGEEAEPKKLSKTQQRRRNKAELKLSENRLKAYLKVDSRSKKKAKH